MTSKRRNSTVATSSPTVAPPRQLGGPVAPSTSLLRPLAQGEIALTAGFWKHYQDLNATVVIDHCLQWVERIGWAANFDLAATGEIADQHSGIEFVDSEIYKLLEAMAWELGRSADPVLQGKYDALVDRVAAAQDDDGYLHTSFGRAGQPPRYSNLEWGHELYSFGHLVQAAVARLRTGHDDALPAVARRLADHLYREFGPDGRVAVCGHPEIEPALAELYRATGEQRYLDLAQLFIARRGTGTLAPIAYGQEYFQDEMPVRDATVLRGHSVRALYLASGALDVAVETGDTDLSDAVTTQWATTVARRTYLTGGMGSHHQDEAYGADYELPPDRAYSETCAAIASNMLSWRLLLQSGQAKYADLIERTLLNSILASTRRDGRAFFYTNTLHQRVDGTVPNEDELNARALSSLRAPWFEVSCCPTNIARTLASVELYFATVTDGGVQLHQYGDYTISTTTASGATLDLSVQGGYPFDGAITVTFTSDTGQPIDLTLRVPAWTSATPGDVTLDGAVVSPTDGTVTVTRRFSAGDSVTLRLPVTPRFTTAHPRVDAARGQVAVERGPLVLAVESIDLPAGYSTEQVSIDRTRPPQATADGATVHVRLDAEHPVNQSWPYGAELPLSSTVGLDVEFRPYYDWANRGPSTMRVWTPTA